MVFVLRFVDHKLVDLSLIFLIFLKFQAQIYKIMNTQISTNTKESADNVLIAAIQAPTNIVLVFG